MKTDEQCLSDFLKEYEEVCRKHGMKATGGGYLEYEVVVRARPDEISEHINDLKEEGLR